MMSFEAFPLSPSSQPLNQPRDHIYAKALDSNATIEGVGITKHGPPPIICRKDFARIHALSIAVHSYAAYTCTLFLPDDTVPEG